MTRRIRRSWWRNVRRWTHDRSSIVVARAALLGLAFLVGLAAS